MFHEISKISLPVEVSSVCGISKIAMTVKTVYKYFNTFCKIHCANQVPSDSYRGTKNSEQKREKKENYVELTTSDSFYAPPPLHRLSVGIPGFPVDWLLSIYRNRSGWSSWGPYRESLTKRSNPQHSMTIWGSQHTGDCWPTTNLMNLRLDILVTQRTPLPWMPVTMEPYDLYAMRGWFGRTV